MNAHAGRVIVVDDRSNDSTRIIARNCGATVILGPGRGKGAAMMTGLRFVTSSRVAFIDGDLLGFTPAHVIALTRDNRGMVIGYRDNASWTLSRLPPIGGERCLPTHIARSVNLAGYGAELQLNAAIAHTGLPVSKILLHGVTTTSGYLGPWRLLTIAPHMVANLPGLMRYILGTRQQWEETGVLSETEHVNPMTS